MTPEQLKELAENIHVVRMVIKELSEPNVRQPQVKELANLLAGQTNRYLTEMFYRESLRKNEDGQYFHTDVPKLDNVD